MITWVALAFITVGSVGNLGSTPPLAVLGLASVALYVVPGPPALLREVVMGLAVAVTLISGADYAIRAVRLRRRSRAAHGPAGNGR